MKQILTTKRLILRELTPGDYDALCVMLRDKDVMYAYEHAFSAEEARGWLNRQLDRYKTDGFGLWAVILRENGRLIGQCGITKQDVGGKTVREVGYIFDKNFWHRGYAAEAAAACKNLPQNPNFCMIVPDPEDLWDDTDGNIVSDGMS